MICLASDHGGYIYKEKLKQYLSKKGIDFKDFGTNSTSRCDAIDFCKMATKEVVKNAQNRGIFICRSGHAMAIVANKFNGVRAISAYETQSVKSARKHNDVNVLTTGADFVSFRKFIKIVDVFLKTEFEDDEKNVYKKRLDKLKKLEESLVLKNSKK